MPTRAFGDIVGQLATLFWATRKLHPSQPANFAK
jgi:hypothetical protein